MLEEGEVEEPLELEKDGEEEEEGPLEPKFNYAQITSTDIGKMFDDVPTSMCISDRFLIVGTHAGNVYVMDHLGNIDKESMPPYRAHRSAVTRIGVDETGKYVITCSFDSRVVIKGIACDDYNQTFTVPTTAPRSICLSPDYATANSGQTFAVGERNLTIYTKGFFSHSEKVVFMGKERDGYITRMSWRNAFIAFTNEAGTRVYDRPMERMVTIVPPKHDVDRLTSIRFPANHVWLDDNTLAIGWADTLNIVVIKTVAEGSTRVRRGEIHFTWRLDMFVSGLSFTVENGKWREMVVFGLKVDDEGGLNADFADTASVTSSPAGAPSPIVQVEILEPKSTKEYVLQAEDRVKMVLKPKATAAQLMMAALPDYGLYFLLGPNFLLYAVPYSTDDKVEWRIANGKVEEAWHLASQAKDLLISPTKVGRTMISYLLKEGRIGQATHALKEVCGADKHEWAYYVEVWEEHRMLTMLADVLPTDHPQLEPDCYESVLQAALYNDISLFKKLVLTWSPDIYRVGSLIAITLKRLKDSTNYKEDSSLSAQDESAIYSALAHLYIYQRQFDLAIKLLLAMNDKQIFNVIDKYNLFEVVKDQISDLMSIDAELAIRLLLDHEDALAPSLVMNKIARHPRLQMQYVTKLLARNEGHEFSDQAIRLYAEHDRSRLMPFLRKAESYNMKKAIEICSQKEYVEEMIYLLGKSGNRMEALNIIINRQRRMDMAISFCKEHDDVDLWDHLVDEAVKHPEYMKELLTTAGPCLDPLRVVERLPPQKEFPGLRDALAKILSDYSVQVELEKGCHFATLSDVRLLMSSLLMTAEISSAVSTRTKCAMCMKRILNMNDDVQGDILLFACQHALHINCSHELERKMERPMGGEEAPDCPICSQETTDE